MDVGREEAHSHGARFDADYMHNATHNKTVDPDLVEAEEHVSALEEAILWCNLNKAIVKFGTNYVYIQVKRGNRTVMHGAPTFLQVVEDIAEGRV